MHKRTLYIFAFAVLGMIMAVLAHALFELSMITLLTSDFADWSFGLSWSDWFMIDWLGGIVLLVLGSWLGYRAGRFWWRMLYQPNGMLRKDFRARWRRFGRRQPGR